MILVKCNQCEKKFLKSYSEVKRMKKRKWNLHFCDVKCLSKYGIIIREIKKQNRIEEYNKNPKKCLNCNTPIKYEDQKNKTYCSIKCAAIYTQKDGGHCHWSDEDKKRLSNLAKNNFRFCGWNKGKKYAKTEILQCSNCGKDFSQMLSKSKHSNKTKTCSKECRSKIQSINLKLQYNNGKLVYGGTTKWLKYKDIKVQGSYEYRTCIILDKWKELGKIKNWEYTKDRFKYIGIDNKNHNYLMDFKVWNNDNTFYYLEVKGYEKPNDKLKWKSVVDKGYELKIWFNNDILKEEKEFMEQLA